MGVTFFELCYWHFPRVPSMSFDGDVKLTDVPIKNNQDVYSQELYNIIQKMLETDKQKRPSSAEILELLNIEFNKKYAKNSSIGSVLSCLYAYDELTAYFTKPVNSNEISTNSSKKPISFAYLYGINSITNHLSEDWNNSLCRIRNILINENNRYSGNKEIEVRHILSFLLGKMHKELVKKNNALKNRNSCEIESQNKIQALNSFISSSIKANNSPIFDFFYGLMKTKSTCGKCKETNYSFNYFNFVSFNIDLAQRKQNQLSLVNLFTIQNNILITIDVNNLRYCNQ
jgi:ubiquitin C-terminal hydrolase